MVIHAATTGSERKFGLTQDNLYVPLFTACLANRVAGALQPRDCQAGFVVASINNNAYSCPQVATPRGWSWLRGQ